MNIGLYVARMHSVSSINKKATNGPCMAVSTIKKGPLVHFPMKKSPAFEIIRENQTVIEPNLQLRVSRNMGRIHLFLKC
jgi:hypothetical protein